MSQLEYLCGSLPTEDLRFAFVVQVQDLDVFAETVVVEGHDLYIATVGGTTTL